MRLKHYWPFTTRLEPALVALSDGDFVEALYQRHLGRVADDHGKAHYLHDAASGAAGTLSAHR
jgi:hypothetical protein